MNERIQKLYDQALESKFDYGAGAGVKPGEYYSNYITVLNPKKFAELIVKECSYLADQAHYKATGGKSAGGYIRQHFGVEE